MHTVTFNPQFVNESNLEKGLFLFLSQQVAQLLSISIVLRKNIGTKFSLIANSSDEYLKAAHAELNADKAAANLTEEQKTQLNNAVIIPERLTIKSEFGEFSFLANSYIKAVDVILALSKKEDVV